MKKLIERLLIFLIGIPAVTALVLFDFRHNLILNIAAIIMSGIGAIEFSSMLKNKNIDISKIESFILGTLAPLSMTLNISMELPSWIVPAIVMTSALWVLFSGILSPPQEIEKIILKAAGRFSLIIYPGLFMLWLTMMARWENSYAILLFLFMIFSSDSLAWLFGTLFGKKNRGIIAVSPNKSIAGFVGGLLGPVLIAVLAALFFPSAFSAEMKGIPHIVADTASGFRTLLLPLPLTAAIIGLITGSAAILGDLSESAIKRSCDFKDSGNLMLGRGGVLDSIDSIAVAAPVYYLLYSHPFFI